MTPLNIDWDGNELKLSDIMGTDADIIYKNIESEVNRELLRTAMKSLTKRERKILVLRFGLMNSGNTKTQKDVADLLGDIIIPISPGWRKESYGS